MKTTWCICAFLLIALSSPEAAMAHDVFDEADLLRKALINKDMPFLRSLDRSGEILTEEGLKFLFDAAAMSRVGSGVRPLRDIVAAANPAPLVEQNIIQGQLVYYVYWYIPSGDGAVALNAGHWMRTVAVCALKRDADGNWGFHQHLCFDETEGPFASGAD